MQYFTGSKTHNIALRDRAIDRGFKLNEYGLFTLEADERVAGADEEGIYAALGLAWIPPELREGRGEIEAADARRLPRLVDRSDLRGDLHVHTTETDGRDTVSAMAEAAREAGLEYIAITDHSQALAMANGLDERRALEHAARVRSVDGTHGVRLLAGIECDIRPDGTLDLSDDCLAALDLVVASVHSAFNQDRQQMTDRLLRAIDNPHVDIIGHPTGPADPEARAVSAGHRSHRRRRGATRRRTGDQLPGGPARSQRCPRETRPRSRRPHRHLERRAFARGLRRAPLGRRGRPAGMARARTRLEHPAVRRAQGEPPAATPMTALKLLTPDDKLAEIRRLYYATTKQTIRQDLERAMQLLKSMSSEEERERAAVYMDGLSQMRSDWARQGKDRRTKTKRRTPT